jgi:hypothetical protein
MPSELHQIPLRVDDKLFSRIEKHRERMSGSSPGVDVKRTDAARQLIILGLEAVERGKK